MGRLRLVSDGTSKGTRLFDIDTGARIAGVTRVSWTCDVGGGSSRAAVYIEGDHAQVEFEVVGMEADLGGMSTDEVVAELMEMGQYLRSADGPT